MEKGKANGWLQSKNSLILNNTKEKEKFIMLSSFLFCSLLERFLRFIFMSEVIYSIQS